MALYKKSPHIHGKRASRIRSSISVSTKDVGGNAINTPLSIAFNNTDTTHFNKYKPVYDPDDPEKMIHIVYSLKDQDDSSIIYIKPDELDADDFESFQRKFQENKHSFYTLYAESAVPPTTKFYSFMKTMTVRDWEHPFGFKLVIGPGLLNSGKVYLGLRSVKGNVYILIKLIVCKLIGLRSR